MYASPSPSSVSSFATSRKSPYHPFLNYKLLQMVERGTINRLNQKYEIGRPGPDCSPMIKVTKRLSIEKMISLFFTLGLGMILALLVLLLEKFFWRKPNKREKNGEDTEFNTALANFEKQLNRLADTEFKNYVLNSSLFAIENMSMK